MALKKSIRVQKLFVADVRCCVYIHRFMHVMPTADCVVFACVQVEKCLRLDKEGEQVLSSMANVAQRLPLLLAQDDKACMGVLVHSSHTQSLLLCKHFVSLEKSSGFLRDIVRSYQDTVKSLAAFASEYAELLQELSGEIASTSLYELLDWMENVRVMFEREVLRKKLLVVDVAYNDSKRIAQMHAQWSTRCALSQVNHAYGALWILRALVYGGLVSL